MRSRVYGERPEQANATADRSPLSRPGGDKTVATLFDDDDAMRVVVLSDTHIPDFAKALPARVIAAARACDLILHAGDVTSAPVLDELTRLAPVRVAMGNNDRPDVATWGAEAVVRLDLDGVPTVMLHDSGPREGRERRLRRAFPDARLFVFGHSHIPIDAEVNGVRFFNPGSATWKRRQPFATYGVLSIMRGKLTSRLVALG